MGKQNKETAEERKDQITENENQTTENVETEETQNTEAETDESQQLTLEEELQVKLSELNDKYLRLYSDFENFRKRTIKEKSDLIMNANEGVIKDMLPILDDFERAIANNETSDDASSIKEGFQLIYSKFNGVLLNKGLKPMDSKGTDFDFDLHEAITNVPVDKKQKGKVVDVVEKGYFLNDKVIRYAKVVVGQ